MNADPETGSRKLSVLIVDDNVDMLETMNDVLTAAGFEIDTAEDGQKAIDKCAVRSFDIAVLDIQMPVLTGVDTLRAIRKIRPETRFVIMTGYTDSDLVTEAKAEGIAGLLFKPVRIVELLGLLKELQVTR